VIFVSILIHQQVYALKEYVNEDYNIKFEYPDDWIVIDSLAKSEFKVDYDIIPIVEGRPAEAAINHGWPLLFVRVYNDIGDIETFKKIVKGEELERKYSEIKEIQRIDAAGTPAYLILVGGLNSEEINIIFNKANIGYRVSFHFYSSEITDKRLTEGTEMMHSIHKNLLK
jgi:hypothetical protein